VSDSRFYFFAATGMVLTVTACGAALAASKVPPTEAGTLLLMVVGFTTQVIQQWRKSVLDCAHAKEIKAELERNNAAALKKQDEVKQAVVSVAKETASKTAEVKRVLESSAIRMVDQTEQVKQAIESSDKKHVCTFQEVQAKQEQARRERGEMLRTLAQLGRKHADMTGDPDDRAEADKAEKLLREHEERST
jgi:transketolase